MKTKNLKTIALCLLGITFITNGLYAQDGKTYECEGKKIVTEGKQIANFTGTDDLTRNVFATIRQDSVIYCVVRTNADGSMNKLMKFHMFIGDMAMNVWSTERAFATWSEGSRTMNKLTLYAVDDKQLNWYEEMICDMKQYGLYRKQVLEMSFDNEADAKDFFAKIQATHMALAPKTDETADKGGNKTDSKNAASGTVVFYNDMGKDMYIKKDNDPTFYHLDMNASKSLTCKAGEKLYWGEKGSGVTKGVIFAVSEQMIKDKTIKLSSGTKK